MKRDMLADLAFSCASYLSRTYLRRPSRRYLRRPTAPFHAIGCLLARRPVANAPRPRTCASSPFARVEVHVRPRDCLRSLAIAGLGAAGRLLSRIAITQPRRVEATKGIVRRRDGTPCRSRGVGLNSGARDWWAEGAPVPVTRRRTVRAVDSAVQLSRAVDYPDKFASPRAGTAQLARVADRVSPSTRTR
jgi:hypothetical protein